VKLAKRAGAKKACVAVARKLAIIMHRMWVEETNAAPMLSIDRATSPKRD
jgi:hypothetical protein